MVSDFVLMSNNFSMLESCNLRQIPGFGYRRFDSGNLTFVCTNQNDVLKDRSVSLMSTGIGIHIWYEAYLQVRVVHYKCVSHL